MGGMSEHISEAMREVVALMADGQVRTTREIANTLGRAKSQVDGVIRRYLTLGKRRVQTVNGTEVQYWMLTESEHIEREQRNRWAGTTR